MYQSHSLPDYDIPLESFLSGIRGVQPREMAPLLRDMRALIPVEGDDWVKAITVAIEPYQADHQGQVAHLHDEWTAVYYHSPGGIPLIVEGQELMPAPGDVVVLPPGTEHQVAHNSRNRLRVSLAMLVPEAGKISKFSA